MKRARPPRTVGSYLVWRRGPMAVRLLAVLAAMFLLGQGAACAILPGGVPMLLGLGVLTVTAGGVAWRVLRDARTPMKAVVSSEGLALEPLGRGEAFRWTWRELSLLRTREDDGTPTLEIYAPRTGTLLLEQDDQPLGTLVKAIRAHGGEVRDDR